MEGVKGGTMEHKRGKRDGKRPKVEKKKRKTIESLLEMLKQKNKSKKTDSWGKERKCGVGEEKNRNRPMRRQRKTAGSVRDNAIEEGCKKGWRILRIISLIQLTSHAIGERLLYTAR